MTTMMLKPWAPLARLRSARLYAVSDILKEYDCRARALRLYRDHLPEALATVAGCSWLEILSCFLHEVSRRDWLPVNWADLEQSYRYFLEDPRENSEEITQYLDVIPLELYGLSPEDDRSPLAMLGLSLAGGMGCSFGGRLGSPTGSLRARLRDIEARPAAYPEPLRWLPAWARWAEGATGNVILDGSYDTDDPPECRWADLADIRAAWQQAKPIIDCFERRFVAWYRHDPIKMTGLVQALVVGEDYSWLNW